MSASRPKQATRLPDVALSEQADRDSTILIVDDSVELLDLCSRFLSDHFRVQIAADGETGCRIAESAAADYITKPLSLEIMLAPVPHDQTVATMLAERGRHFDPDILDTFLEIHEDFHEVAQRYLDRHTDLERPVG